MAPPIEEDEFNEEDFADDGAEVSEEDLSAAESLPTPEASPSVPPPAPPSPRPPPADPGFFTTVGHNLLSGFAKQGSDELSGAIARMGTSLMPGARYKMPDGTTRPLDDGGDVYRAVRDTERETLRGGNEHHPWTAFASNMAGDMASDAALSALGVPVSSTPYQVATGALSGLMGSDAELTGEGVRGADVASAAGSTALGGVLGYALPKVGAAVSRQLTPALASRMRQWLENSAINQGRRVLLNGATTMMGNKELSADAVREALESKAIPAFGTTQDAYRNLETLAEMRGENYGDILKRLQANGVEGPNVDGMASFFDDKAADMWRNSGANKSISEEFAKQAANIRAVAPPAPGSFEIVGEGPMAVSGPRLPPMSAAPPTPAGPQLPQLMPPASPSGAITPPVLTPPPARVTPPAAGEPTRAMRPPPAAPVPPPAPAPVSGPVRDALGRYLPRGSRGEPAMPAAPMDFTIPPVAPPATPLDEFIHGPMAERLPLNQAERIKRILQDEARYDRLRLTGLDEAKQEVAATYRKGIEDSIAEAGEAAPPGSEVAELASEFMPVKQQLARTLAAREAAERGTAAAAKRRGISLTDYLSAGAAAGGGLHMQLLAAAGNNFARNRGTSAWAAGAYGASKSVGDLANPLNAERFGNTAGALMSRQVSVGGEGENGGAGSQRLTQALQRNPTAFGQYAQRLSQAASQGEEALALQDYMLAQSDPNYAQTRRQALMEANGERE